VKLRHFNCSGRFFRQTV